MTQWCNRTDNVLKLEQRARVWLAEQQKRLAKKTRHAMESLDSHLYHDVIATSSTPTGMAGLGHACHMATHKK